MSMKMMMAVLAACVLSSGAVYSADEPSAEERIAKLEQQVQALTSEMERDLFGDVIPELGESVHGMGPAASKVYNKEQGLSIGGYGEVLYQNYNGSDSDETDEIDMLRAILYFGYKFTDKWVLNTEIEWEHGGEEASVEFAYLDYLHSESINFRAGLVLIPVGIVNELHEPTVFLGAKRSTLENRIIPTTWRENGAGVFGDVGPVSYKVYVVNSLDGEGFSAQGIRGGRQKGSEAKAEDFSVVVRTDVELVQGVTLGASVYAGDQAQDLDVDANLVLAEAHLMARKAGFTFNALVVGSNLDNADELNLAINADPADDVGEQMFGWYAELGYDVLAALDQGEMQLTPFVRIENVDTQHKIASGSTVDADAFDLDIITIGLNFKPIDEVVFKLEHQFIEDGNSDRFDQTNLALGYIF